ncbi:MAG: hypothetical protein C4520_13610 [Candidatus Abyssobacteria bacterium SURF_5]|uniref:Uncharacterized protein n=1 Tax=Abyssobacteria bacterium (strain SURF_5) TaxID=2093360 RepID=A0A3A4NCL2_ABYX5|nr:MAG: hypothetical protein C4520_13610 [Candidatus Abyssubacteria bacterium SURF_5]
MDFSSIDVQAIHGYNFSKMKLHGRRYMKRFGIVIVFAIVLSSLLFPEQQAPASDEGDVVLHEQTSAFEPAESASALGEPAISPNDTCSGKCGGAINRFFAFGCRLNYRILDWTLSDKCETEIPGTR